MSPSWETTKGGKLWCSQSALTKEARLVHVEQKLDELPVFAPTLTRLCEKCFDLLSYVCPSLPATTAWVVFAINGIHHVPHLPGRQLQFSHRPLSWPRFLNMVRQAFEAHVAALGFLEQIRAQT